MNWQHIYTFLTWGFVVVAFCAISLLIAITVVMLAGKYYDWLERKLK